jgi:hypothetical protein
VKTPTDKRREAFRAWVQEHGQGVTKVAERSGVPKTTLYSYLGGKSRSLKGETEDAIVRAYGVTTEDLFGLGGVRSVPVVGYVGAGAAAHYYDSSQGALDHVPAPENAHPNTVAREIKGQSIGRRFDGWLIFADDAQEAVTPDLYGQLCVCGLPDGRVLVKWLEPARTSGLFHLASETEETLYDQPVAWASRVTSMRPR